MSRRRSDVLIDLESDSSDLEKFLDLSTREVVKKPRAKEQNSRPSNVQKLQRANKSLADLRSTQILENGELGGVSSQNVFNKKSVTFIVS